MVRFKAIGSLVDTNLICKVITDRDHPGMYDDSLYQCHIRPGHQSYAAIEELAAKLESGINLTGHEKPHCLACAEGKQTRNNQPKQDSGNSAPIYRIGGVICSDLKISRPRIEMAT
jgi:hypothetical protein